MGCAPSRGAAVGTEPTISADEASLKDQDWEEKEPEESPFIREPMQVIRDAPSDFLRSMKNGAGLSDVEGILLAAKDAGQPLEPLVNARGMWGNTPLILACQNGLAQVSLILLRAGADVNHKNDRSASALLYACMEGLEDVVNSMLALGANVDIPAVLVYSPASDSMQTLSPLMAAVRNGHVGVCEALLQSGANPDKFASDCTPLMTAAFLGNDLILECLLRHGASLSVVDNHGRNALCIACESGHKGAAYLLAATPPSASNPLNYAVLGGSVAIVRILLEAGFNPQLRDVRDGLTPLELTIKLGRPSCTEIVSLLRHNASPTMQQCSTARQEDIALGTCDNELAEFLRAQRASAARNRAVNYLAAKFVQSILRLDSLSIGLPKAGCLRDPQRAECGQSLGYPIKTSTLCRATCQTSCFC
jgi:hypothetical protein